MADFSGQLVFLVGGSQGIGRAAAEQLAAQGAHVVVMARSEEALADTVQAMQARASQSNQQLLSARLDVTDAEHTREVIDALVETLGAPDVLINCAGAAIPQEFDAIDDAAFDRTLKLNLYGTRNLAAAGLRHMNAGARFYATSSMAGFIGVYGYTDYCAAKFGVIGFCEALRAEMKPRGIHVGVLCPPDTDTPGFANENLTKPGPTAAISASAKLMSADAVAKQFLAGVAKRRFMIVPGADGKLALWLQRLAPALLRIYGDAIVRKSLRDS